MSDYLVVARKYRPQTFKDVLGQDPLVTTLKNAIKYGRLAQAYLFSGSRGTGKTTLARILAKALNCRQLTQDFEPCNACSSCKEIAAGHSLDVLEIDGASNRGIEDIRQINDTVGYAASSGMYKIYIIDEVHMLTKEAFNALLKTLEEPPPKVKFLFATTEPHKVLPTIVSRCQRFNLNRIPPDLILQKLIYISQQLGIDADEEALRIIAQMAEGGLRDAESLLDQIFAFHEGRVTSEIVQSIFGVMSRETFFEIDKAAKEGDLGKAFEITDRIFGEGKDLSHFLEGLIDHFRTLLLVKLSGKNAPFLSISSQDRQQYENAAQLYTQEQCLTILEHLLQAQQEIRFSPSPKISTEAILLKILRIHQRLPIEVLVQKLHELEKRLEASPSQPAVNILTQEPIKPPLPAPKTRPVKSSLTVDPTPSVKDIPNSAPTSPKPTPKPAASPQALPSVRPQVSHPEPVNDRPLTKQEQSRYDTLMQFSAVELEGTLQRKSFKQE